MYRPRAASLSKVRPIVTKTARRKIFNMVVHFAAACDDIVAFNKKGIIDMTWTVRAAVGILAGTLVSPLALAQDPGQSKSAQAIAAETPATSGFSATQTREIESIVKNYLMQHPEIVQDAIEALYRRQKEADADKVRITIKENKATIFDSSHQVVLGNPQGNVTMVEFFDYNCGFCKRALPNMLTLLKTDPDLRFVLKEYPVLGPGSVDAAHVAVAARMQDQSGKKYMEFHQKLLGDRGPADKAHALAVARDVGFDMARIEEDMNSDEVKTTIEENLKLAEALGVSGTPSYVVGREVVPGAVGVDELREKIKNERK
jgi:protein-disulfide isomerase